MPLPPEPIVIPTSLTYRSALGRVLPLSNLELDGNMAYLEKLAEERLPIRDFTGQNIIDLINQTDNSGIDAATLSSFRANIEPNINSIPVRDNNGVIFASGVTAKNFYGKAETAGDADTAKKLKTPVKINTVNFDGTADITISDNTKLPLAGGTLTGKVTLSPASALASGIQITPGTAPDSPVNGDVWITNAGQLNQIAGVTRSVAYTDSNITGTAANVTGIVAIGNGGTGATVANVARSNIGAAASGANSDITSLSGLTTALSTSQGGTGLKSPGQAGNILRSNGTTWESVTPSTNVVTATALETPRAINGVNFDGTADITIADNTKLSLAGGTLTGKLIITQSDNTSSGFQITPGGVPDSPVNGDIWLTDSGQYNRINGVTRTVAYTDSNITGTAANVTGIVAIGNGGTGSTTAVNARTNIGAAASGANSDITSLSGLTTALSVSQGGTGLKSPGLVGNILTSNGTTWESVTPSTNAATATALQTPRAINGVNFNGTADITIADSTKLPLAGGTLTGKLFTSGGLSITPGTAPDSPVNGDVWITNTGQFNRIAGVTRSVVYTDSNITGTAANVTGIVAIGNGGTGSTTAVNARSNLGAAASGANSDITSLSGLTTALSTSQGGTGLKSPGQAGNILRSNGTTWESTPQFSTLPFIGVVAYFATTSIEPGWLPCDGAQYSRVEYKQLYDKIGITFGNGDGSGTTFNVPNLLNEFIRGVAPGRIIGSIQNDDIRSHAHAGLNSPTTKSYISLNRQSGSDAQYATGNNITESTGSFGGSETRPRNIALLPCIFSGILNLPSIFKYPTEEPKTYNFDLTSGKVNITEGDAVYFVLQCIANKVVPITSAYWEVDNTGNQNNTSFIATNGTFITNTTMPTDIGNLAAGTFAVQTISSGTSRPNGAFTVSVYTDSSKSILLDSLRVTVAGIAAPVPTSQPTAAPTQAPTPEPTPAPVKTFTITSDSTNINYAGTAFFTEGQTATIIVNTSNVPNKSTYKWSVTPVTAALTDLSPVSGTFTINNNVGSFTIGVGTDLIIENTEYFKVIIQDFVGNTLATSGDIGVINLPIPTPAPTTAPAKVEKVWNLVAYAKSVGFAINFSSSLIGETLYITADRRSSGGTDNDYVTTVTVPNDGTVIVTGPTSKFSAGQVVAVKTVGPPNHKWDGPWVASTTAVYSWHK